MQCFLNCYITSDCELRWRKKLCSAFGRKIWWLWLFLAPSVCQETAGSEGSSWKVWACKWKQVISTHCRTEWAGQRGARQLQGLRTGTTLRCQPGGKRKCKQAKRLDLSKLSISSRQARQGPSLSDTLDGVWGGSAASSSEWIKEQAYKNLNKWDS